MNRLTEQNMDRMERKTTRQIVRSHRWFDAGRHHKTTDRKDRQTDRWGGEQTEGEGQVPGPAVRGCSG